MDVFIKHGNMALFLRDKKDEEKLKKWIKLGNEMFDWAKGFYEWNNIGDTTLRAIISYAVYNILLGDPTCTSQCQMQNLDPNPSKTIITKKGSTTIQLDKTTCSSTCLAGVNGLNNSQLAAYAAIFLYYWHQSSAAKSFYSKVYNYFSNYFFPPNPSGAPGVTKTSEILELMKNFFIMGQKLPDQSKQTELQNFFKSIAVLFVSCLANTCFFKHELQPSHEPQTHAVYNNSLQKETYESLWKKLEKAFQDGEFTADCFNEHAIQLWNSSSIFKQLG